MIMSETQQPTMMPERTSEEREFLVWLRSVEKRAILPLKWCIFVTALIFWVLSHPAYWPLPVEVFTLFTLYLMYNVGESYFFWLSRVSLSQVRSSCILSYIVDVLFVTILVYFDTRRYPAVSGQTTDFYLFYFLLILRGFALFRAPRMNLAVNAIVGVIFVITLLWQDTSLFTYSSRNNMIRVVFIWLLILMSWFIVEIINRQKEEIMRARMNLLRSENMAMVGELAAGVAHEINNPIGIISAYAEFLKKNAPPGDTRTEDFEIIYKEARRCQNIVAEMLNYARPTRRSTSPTDLRAINDEVLEFLFRRQGKPEIKVEKEYPAALPLVMLDHSQFKQALLNIYLNARQAMLPDGGSITVRILSDPERNMVRQYVIDTGRGIDREQLNRVFDPFFTTRTGGTGLGLSITKRIIESHGGHISVRSDNDKGTRVKISLPYDITRMA
jgi:signal transduction histidine kinase